jgi:Protein of unknown function (DUF2796).
MSRLLLGLGLSLAALSVAAPAAAGPERQHGPHVHGRGQLTLALEGNALVANLTVPGADLVGFEHAPHTEAQTKAVASAVATLGDGPRILGLPAAAACTQSAADVQSAQITDDHDHDEEEMHSDDKHADHDHDMEAHGAEHAEFRVTYRLTCASPDKLDHLAVGYFAAFDAAKELVVQAVGPWGQTAKTLTPQAPRLTF